MKKFSFVLLLAFLSIGCSSDYVKVMTYNIRLNTPNDGENSWIHRSNFLTDQIRNTNASIVGVQEALPGQMKDIKRLMPKYDYIGIGRDFNSTGEYSAIFFRKDLYTVANANTFWLSNSPKKVSKDWDAALPRICTYGLFTHKSSGIKIWVFNTHFDHVGAISRIESAKLIMEKIKEVNKNNFPVILMGDLNVEPDNAVLSILELDMKDAFKLTQDISGPIATFNGFDTSKEPNRRIDYILVSKNIESNITKYKVLEELKDGRYPSDHFPVVIELKLN